MAVCDEAECPLHEAVFNNDVTKLSQFLRTENIAKKDVHGNTPLHLAVMLGHRECIELLLAHNAPIKVKNVQGWTPLAEAVSYGDRNIVTSVLHKLKQQSREAVEVRRRDMCSAFKMMGDFYMELKWDFQSWIPLISRVLPSDLCKIYKKGSNIRLDTTLIDFHDMKWERGDISFLYVDNDKPTKAFVVLDNQRRVYQNVCYEESESEIEEEVDIMLSCDIVSAQISTKNVNFSRAQSGWLLRANRSEMVGRFMADFYYINGLTFESRKRREHLSDEDRNKNKALIESLKNASAASNLDVNPSRRRSLPPPPKANVNYSTYMSGEPGNPPSLGRPLVSKTTTKVFNATLAMSTDFPLTVSALLSVLEIVAPFKHFTKLKEFCEMKLPPGFPVKIDIPILPTVTAKITFQEFEYRDDLEDSLFKIPDSYREDRERFSNI